MFWVLEICPTYSTDSPIPYICKHGEIATIEEAEALKAEVSKNWEGFCEEAVVDDFFFITPANREEAEKIVYGIWAEDLPKSTASHIDKEMYEIHWGQFKLNDNEKNMKLLGKFIRWGHSEWRNDADLQLPSEFFTTEDRWVKDGLKMSSEHQKLCYNSPVRLKDGSPCPGWWPYAHAFNLVAFENEYLNQRAAGYRLYCKIQHKQMIEIAKQLGIADEIGNEVERYNHFRFQAHPVDHILFC